MAIHILTPLIFKTNMMLPNKNPPIQEGTKLMAIILKKETPAKSTMNKHPKLKTSPSMMPKAKTPHTTAQKNHALKDTIFLMDSLFAIVFIKRLHRSNKTPKKNPYTSGTRHRAVISGSEKFRLSNIFA
jgi:hypothetical protein